MEESNENSFLIVDGNSILNRAFYGIRLLSTSDGVYTNAVYGFLNIYYMIIEKINPKYVAVTFDVSKPTFRHELYSEYKGKRKSMPEELRPQLPLLKEILTYMNIKIFEKEGFEADDIVGTVSSINSKNGIHTYVLSGDRDTLQLIDDNTTILMPSNKPGKTEYIFYDKTLLKEKYNITPSQVIDVKSLMGDASDNIKGVAKIGEKTAYSLIEKYKNIDTIYENIDTIEVTNSVRENLKAGRKDAYLSYKLATIKRDVDIDLDYNELTIKPPQLAELTNIFNRLSFKKFVDRYTNGEVVKTNDELKLFADFSKYEFLEISNENKANLKDYVTDITSFVYYDKNFSISSYRGNLYIYNPNVNKIVYFNVENNLELLKEYVTTDYEKNSFDIKPLFKICIDNGINEFKKFSNDIKIGYFLNNSTISNISLDMIAYNLFNIVFNVPDVKNSTVNVQTSIFDAFDSVAPNKQTLDDDEKKYIFSILRIIYMSTEKILAQLKEKELYELYVNIEMPLIETLAAIECAGMYIDKDKLIEFGEYVNKELNDLEKEIYSLTNTEFNINSPKQLQEVLFEKLGLVGTKKNDNGYSTDKDVLEGLIDKHPVIEKILNYRTYAKLKSTYVDGLLSLITNESKLHTTFTQTVTATGRLSSIEPNLQNIPIKTELGGKIRECFVAPNSNYTLIDADYSQIELRILAHMSNDEKMIQAFLDEKDIHTATAASVFKISEKDVTSSLRSKAKAVNFGIVYGISDFGLAKNIQTSRQEAKEFIEAYKETYKGVTCFMEDEITKCKELGYATTLYNRKREVPEIKSSNFNTRSFGERVAMNMPIQGTAADIMKISMNNIYKEFKFRNLRAKIIMQVHDELVVETPMEELEVVKKIVKDCMENVTKFKVPLKVDINNGNSWLDAK